MLLARRDPQGSAQNDSLKIPDWSNIVRKVVTTPLRFSTGHIKEVATTLYGSRDPHIRAYKGVAIKYEKMCYMLKELLKVPTSYILNPKP